MDISELNRVNLTQQLNRHPWEIARAYAVSFILKKNSFHSQHIIDVGSGDIFVLQTLAKNNTAERFSAIDSAYNNKIIQHLKQQPGTEKIDFYTTLDDITAQKKEGTVLLLDVLEHCRNDKEVLSSAVNPALVSEDALFLITVPAYQSLYSQHDDLLKHYRRYSRRNIKAVCSSQNLQVIKSGYFFFSLLPVRLFQLLLEKKGLRKPKKSIDNWNGNKIVTKIISSILQADFRICYALSSIGIHLPGLSCYCICKKLPS
jgi:hypothetical protein